MGIRYHGHGSRGNVVESMNVIGHGKESPWGESVKFFPCGVKTWETNMKVKDLIKKLREVDQELEVVVCVAGSDVEVYEVEEELDHGWEPSGVITLNTGKLILE